MINEFIQNRERSALPDYVLSRGRGQVNVDNRFRRRAERTELVAVLKSVVLVNAVYVRCPLDCCPGLRTAQETIAGLRPVYVRQLQGRSSYGLTRRLSF